MKVKHKFHFSNEHIFPAVMKDIEICRGVLGRILPDKNLDRIIFHDGGNDGERRIAGASETREAETEKTISFDAETKGVRLDAFCEDDEAWYNIEMECTRDRYLPMRFRYYGSSTDMDQLRKGDEYTALKHSYIIFLCTFDLFGLDEPIYFFENRDVKNGLKLGDKTYKIIVNAKCAKPDLPKGLRALLDYIDRKELDESDDLICAIDRKVGIVNRESSDWRREAMWSREKYRIWEKNREIEAVERGHSAGLAEGRNAGLAEGRNAGLAEGRKEGIEEIARNLKADGIPTDIIARNTGLSEEDVNAL